MLDCYAATNQNVAGIHVYETEHIPEYVYRWLASQYLESRSTETGTAQPALSAERVKRMPILLPLAEEQQRIVEYLAALQLNFDKLEITQQQTAAELDALMPAVLNKDFRGEL